MSSASEQVIGLYERHARKWDAERGRSLFEKPWLDRFASYLPDGGAILDLGCGSGQPIAEYLIERGFRITGVDSSATLIAYARTRFPGHDWIVEDMRTLSLGRRFKGMLAWDSFFHLAMEDQRRMFPIFRNHADAGAALMFTSGASHGVAIGAFAREPLYHASLSEGEYRSRLAAHGFELVKRVAEDPDCGGHTILLARFEG